MEEFVVIGGGLMGSAAAWQLSNNGQKIILVEQQDSLYTLGSSFGEARISRSLGPKNDIFSYLQQTSISETRKLINYLNDVSDSEIHKMEDIYTTSPVTYIYYESQRDEVDQLLDGQTDKYEVASGPEEALEMFDMVIPDSAMGRLCGPTPIHWRTATPMPSGSKCMPAPSTRTSPLARSTSSTGSIAPAPAPAGSMHWPAPSARRRG